MSETEQKVGRWLEDVVKGLVSHPDDVTVEQSADDEGVFYTIKTNRNDVGQVIGRRGTIAEALRVILRSAAFLLDFRASTKVYVPGSDYHPYPVNDEETHDPERT